MSRVDPLLKQRLLYLGEISEPPKWLPSAALSIIVPSLGESRVGLFCIDNPSTEKARVLENMAEESGGTVAVFKAEKSGLFFCAGPLSLLLGHEEFAFASERYSARRFNLKLRDGSLELGDFNKSGGRTKIMGILNVTPDSFSDGGHFHAFDAAVAQAEKMVEEGVDIIDIGGESTRPGSAPVPVEEELRRVLPVIEHLAKNIPVPVSIDTCKAEIARRAIDAGAEMINDVSALRFDPQMLGVAREAGCPVILMHMLGTPKDMQRDPVYEALMPEIISFLGERAAACIEGGICPESIVVDPGIGFGKTVEHNLEMIRELDMLRALGFPVLIGPSRKSTIGVVLDADIDDRVEGTAAVVAVSIMKHAHIVRVHDVKEMARVAKMTDAVMGKEWK